MPADAPPEHISLLPAAFKTPALSRCVIDRRVTFLAAQLSGTAYTDYAWQEFGPMDLLDPDVSTSDTRNYAKRHHGQHLPTCGELTQDDLALLDLDPGIVLPPEMLQYRRARMALLVDDAWLKIKSASKTGHHPLQWAGYHEVCRQKGKPAGNFTGIATDDVAMAFRRQLVAMRCCCVPRPSVFQGAVVTSLIYSLSTHNTTEERLDTSLGETLGTQKGSGTQKTQDNVYYLLCDALDLKAGQAVAEGEGAGQMRAKRAYENQKPVVWAKLPSILQRTWKMAAMCRRTGLFTAFSLNFAQTRLDKYSGKGRGNGADAWHKRITTMLRSLMPDELFSFAVERDRKGRWHIHCIVYGIHEEAFEERYSDALKRLGGNYTEKAEKHQLDVQGGYGFNRMLGWIDYSTKSGNVWFESQALTRHGKALYEEVCETWLNLSRQRSMAEQVSVRYLASTNLQCRA